MADPVYGLPSVDLALGIVDNDQGHSSGLSEAPSDIDESDIEHFSDADFDDFHAWSRRSRDPTPRQKRSFSTFAEDPFFSDDELSYSGPTKVARTIPDDEDLAYLETAPAEV